MSINSVGVVVLGCGVVGSSVVAELLQRSGELADRAGIGIELRGVAVRDTHAARRFLLPPELITGNADEAVVDPRNDVVVELIGGEEPALALVRRALQAGKQVITANKEIVAKHGAELLAAARENGGSLRYEASVGGGIPVVEPFKRSLVANRVQSIKAIINGTTNYILTAMAVDGSSLEDALREAQAKGFAEPEPSNDIDGHDAVYKLAILASLAFRMPVRPEMVYREGIRGLHARDFRHASELGYAIKLLAIGKEIDGSVEVRVHPALIPLSAPLAQVNGAFNAVQVEGDLSGPVMFWGQGAGPRPTTSAVLADIVAAAAGLRCKGPAEPPVTLDRDLPIVPMDAVSVRYYLRMQILDSHGVLAQIARVLGEHRISIASVVQKETVESTRTAEIVLMTHLATERAMRDAVAALDRLQVLRDLSSFIRVED